MKRKNPDFSIQKEFLFVFNGNTEKDGARRDTVITNIVTLVPTVESIRQDEIIKDEIIRELKEYGF